MVGSAVTHSALLLGRGLLEPIATGGLQRAAVSGWARRGSGSLCGSMRPGLPPAPPRLPLPQAPLVSALLCTSQRGGIWRFGSSALHSSAAAAAEGGAKEGEQAAAGEQAAGEQAAAEQAPQMSAEECAAALAEAREALEGEKKRVGGRSCAAVAFGGGSFPQPSVQHCCHGDRNNFMWTYLHLPHPSPPASSIPATSLPG